MMPGQRPGSWDGRRWNSLGSLADGARVMWSAARGAFLPHRLQEAQLPMSVFPAVALLLSVRAPQIAIRRQPHTMLCVKPCMSAIDLTLSTPHTRNCRRPRLRAWAFVRSAVAARSL